MDLVESLPDLKILAGKCYVSRSVWVFSGFGEKIRDRTDQIEFWKKDPLSTAGVVGLAGGRFGSDRIYRVDQVGG